MTILRGYVRLSTDEQDLGGGRSRQLISHTAYAQAKGYELVTTFEGEPFEDVGFSGLTGAHIAEGKFGRYLQAVRDGKIKDEVLGIEAFDRFGRQHFMTANRYFSEIIEKGVPVAITKDSHEYTTEIDLGQMVMALFGMQAANQASEDKRRYQTSVQKGKRDSGRKLGKFKPAWLDIIEWDYSGKTPAPTKFAPNKHAETVVTIFEESAAGVGCRNIATKLNDMKVATFGTKSKQWTSGMVEHVLNNIAVLGWHQHYKLISKRPQRREPIGEINKNYWGVAVIDETLWKRSVAEREKNKTYSAKRKMKVGKGGRNASDHKNLFSGLARCGYCDEVMHFYQRGMTGRKENKRKAHYLVCHNYHCPKVDEATYPYAHSERLTRAAWNYDDFQKTFLFWFRHKVDLKSIMENEEEANKRRELSDDIKADEGALRLLETEQLRLIKTRDEMKRPSRVLAEELDKLEDAIFNLEEGKKEKEAKLEQMKTEAVSLEESKDIKLLIDRLGQKDEHTFKLRAQIHSRLKSLVKRIRLYTDGVELGAFTSNIHGFVPDAKVLKGRKERFFDVQFKDGSWAPITPAKNDPYGPIKTVIGVEDAFGDSPPAK